MEIVWEIIRAQAKNVSLNLLDFRILDSIARVLNDLSLLANWYACYRIKNSAIEHICINYLNSHF